MEQIDVRILDRDYRLAVGPDEKPRLIEAAALVDQTMRAVRDENRLTHLDRIAIGAALQLAEQLILARQPAAPGPDSARRLRAVNEALEAEIRRQESLF
ncbi:MAG: cell division protein ZapA [Betaproteobacteria bacterium]|nr:cell division protein ZapA [Betaproteobacteria bacterium]